MDVGHYTVPGRHNVVPAVPVVDAKVGISLWCRAWSVSLIFLVFWLLLDGVVTFNLVLVLTLVLAVTILFVIVATTIVHPVMGDGGWVVWYCSVIGPNPGKSLSCMYQGGDCGVF